MNHHGIPPSGHRGATPSQKGLVAFAVHGQTIDLSISDAAEIHFEELQLRKTNRSESRIEEVCLD